jgi:pimeloyl-ACP methyl ester carboxylesterase
MRSVAAILVTVALLAAAPAAEAGRGKGRPKNVNPIIFVHGGFGSGAQFESQAMRFARNGYRSSWLRVLDYDSGFGVEDMATVHERLDALIADTKADTGRAKVDLLGHSLGTRVLQAYLSSPQRAANVAHYVNIDGFPASSPPGGVPTLAVWAGFGTPGRTIPGATNVTIPNQTHVQVATSAQSFRHYYKFFTGRRPKRGIKRKRGRITLAGRAVLFPQNVGVQDVDFRIYEVDARGRRKRSLPLASPRIGSDGSWGPVRVRAGRRHEFALSRPTGTHHIYYEPFPRSDHLVRLLTSEPGAGADLLIEKSPRHSAAVFTRNKEFWGDQGAQSDVLEVNGTNVVNPGIAPVSKRAIAIFAFDRGSDGQSNTSTSIPIFTVLPFLTGVDLFMPSSSPTTGTVRVRLHSRGRRRARDVSFPNFPSSTDRVSVQFHDFEPRQRARWRPRLR